MIRQRLLVLGLLGLFATIHSAQASQTEGNDVTKAVLGKTDKPKPADKPKPPAPKPAPKPAEKPKAPEKPKEPEKGHDKAKPIAVGNELDAALVLNDIDAKAHKFADLRGKVVVVQFWSARSPAANAYDKRLAEMIAAESAKGVVFLGIDSDKADVDGAKDPMAALHDALKAHGLDGKLPLVLDKDGALMTQFGAKAAGPHAFVIDTKGVVRYSGAIDDDPAGDRKDGVKHYLSDAVEAVLAGKPVAVPTTSPGEGGKK